MNIQPIDLPSLVRAVTWPVITIIALAIFWRPLTDLVKILAPRINKLSVGGLSLELAQVSEIKAPTALDTEIRQLDAGLVPQSGVTGLTGLLSQLQHGSQRDYIVIDLGSEASRRWLTSRLYLLALLITLVDRPLCMVFVETVGDIRKRFVGTASPDQVRWALARTYSWLEAASAAAYAVVGGLQWIAGGLMLPNPTMNFQFDPLSGNLSEFQLSQVVQQFLTMIRVPQPPAGGPPPDSGEWTLLGNQTYEHAKWIDGARIEHLLGSSLNASYAMLLPNKTVNDLSDVVLRQQGRFVAVVEQDKTFHGLIDRSAVLESVAHEFSKQVSSTKS